MVPELLDRFLRWIYPARYSETAKCELCRNVLCKTRMVHDAVYGWFCNEEELGIFWQDNQW